MRLTKQPVLQNGVLLSKENSGDVCDRVFIYQQFRFFFSVNGNQYSPADLTDSDADGIPNYIIHLLHKLVVSYSILVEALNFRDLLSGGIFHALGARYIDIYLDDIPVSHGFALATVFDLTPGVLANTAFNGKSLKIIMHRGLHAGTATPMHELLHLFQFSYVPFNNMWLMEGLARWGQRLIQTGSSKIESLPVTQVALEALLKKSYEAEYFWNRLAALCEDNRYFSLPENLIDCEVPVNTQWTNGLFMRVFLQQCENNVAQMLTEQSSRNLPGNGTWTREEKRSANNNYFILKAILETIAIIAPPSHPELEAFTRLIASMVNNNIDQFSDPAIQKFMLLLQKFNIGKVCVDTKAVLYSDYFDVNTGTLSIQTLDFIGQTLTNADLAAFSVVRNIIGNLRLSDNSTLTSLNGLDNLESIAGDLTITQTGIKYLNGLNRLERVQGKIDISHNTELLTINGLTSLNIVDALISIVQNAVLITINGFNSLQQIKKGALRIEQCPQLGVIRGFVNLSQVQNIELKRLNITQVDFLNRLIKQHPEFKGSIKITSCRLESLSGFSGLKSVGSSFYLHGNKLKNLKGLEHLHSVGASFSLASNQLADISQLAKLESVNGMLGLAYNQLTSLHGLENLKLLKTVNWSGEKRTLVINDNKQLKDIKALSNMLTGDNYAIIYADDYRQYQIKPEVDSGFHKNIIELHDSRAGKIIPTYSFINKSRHDYANFRNTTHNRLLNYLLDFETDANNLVISFTGFNGNLGGVFYNRYPWIVDNMQTHKIFMNDTQNIWYHKGIPAITKNMEENIRFIQELVKQKKYKKILCIGTSMGGYMSLLIGYLIHATDIIAFAPQIFLDKENRTKYNDTRWTGALKSLPKLINPKYLDLSLLYQEKSNLATNIQIHYGKQLALDQKHIEHLGKYPNIQLYPYDIEDHYIPKYLDGLGLLHKIIAEALTGSNEN